jgi:hypothetical protein
MGNGTMKERRLGLALFVIGAVIIFGVTWITPWFTSPVWSSAPPEHCEGTVWEAFGPIFMTMSLLTPAGILLLAFGTLLLGDSVRAHIWPYSIGLVIVVFSFLFPATLGYYPVVFGIAGFLIVVLFFAVLWYWAQNHRHLKGPARAASVYQLLSYICFFLVALLMCTILGNPFSGLYFPERVMEQNALPFHHSFGTKAVIYFVLAMFFTFLSHF